MSWTHTDTHTHFSWSTSSTHTHTHTTHTPSSLGPQQFPPPRYPSRPLALTPWVRALSRETDEKSMTETQAQPPPRHPTPRAPEPRSCSKDHPPRSGRPPDQYRWTLLLQSLPPNPEVASGKAEVPPQPPARCCGGSALTQAPPLPPSGWERWAGPARRTPGAGALVGWSSGAVPRVARRGGGAGPLHKPGRLWTALTGTSPGCPRESLRSRLTIAPNLGLFPLSRSKQFICSVSS